MHTLLGTGHEPTGPATAAPTSKRRRRLSLGHLAAFGLGCVLLIAVGSSTVANVLTATTSLRELAEQAGSQQARTAAAAFGTLEEASAANVARTLDVVLDEQLRAQAAITGMLIETAEEAGRSQAYIQDALRQITVRSPIWRIDTLSREGRRYTTARRGGLERDEMEQDFIMLSLLPPQGLTEGTAAVETEGGGLTKAAAAQTMHRRMVVRVEQRLQSREAAETYGQPGDQAGRRLAEQQAAAIARLTTHAVELAERADWGAAKIHDRLDTLVEQTAIERIRVIGRNGATLYSVASDEATAAGPRQAHNAPIAALAEQGQGSRALPGWYNSERRWVAAAAATRNNGGLTVAIELATRTGEGSLIEAAWQIEADRLAQVAGITGVWVVEASAGETRLAAAGPRPGREGSGRDAWSRWNNDIKQRAERADNNGGLMSELELDILHSEQASVLSAAPTPGRRQTDERRFLVLMETNADAIVTQMRDATRRSASWALVLIAVITGITSWIAQRWLTEPIRRIAAAARLLQHGRRPPSQPDRQAATAAGRDRNARRELRRDGRRGRLAPRGTDGKSQGADPDAAGRQQDAQRHQGPDGPGSATGAPGAGVADPSDETGSRRHNAVLTHDAGAGAVRRLPEPRAPQRQRALHHNMRRLGQGSRRSPVHGRGASGADGRRGTPQEGGRDRLGRQRAAMPRQHAGNVRNRHDSDAQHPHGPHRVRAGRPRRTVHHETRRADQEAPGNRRHRARNQPESHLQAERLHARTERDAGRVHRRRHRRL